jgi:hypothetical protein
VMAFLSLSDETAREVGGLAPRDLRERVEQQRPITFLPGAYSISGQEFEITLATPTRVHRCPSEVLMKRDRRRVVAYTACDAPAISRQRPPRRTRGRSGGWTLNRPSFQVQVRCAEGGQRDDAVAAEPAVPVSPEAVA